MLTITLTDNNALILKHCINKRINEIDKEFETLNDIGYITINNHKLYEERLTLTFLLKSITDHLKEVKKCE